MAEVHPSSAPVGNSKAAAQGAADNQPVYAGSWSPDRYAWHCIMHIILQLNPSQLYSSRVIFHIFIAYLNVLWTMHLLLLLYKCLVFLTFSLLRISSYCSVSIKAMLCDDVYHSDIWCCFFVRFMFCGLLLCKIWISVNTFCNSRKYCVILVHAVEQKVTCSWWWNTDCIRLSVLTIIRAF